MAEGLPAAGRRARVAMSIRLRLAVVFAFASAVAVRPRQLAVREPSCPAHSKARSTPSSQSSWVQASRYLPASGTAARSTGSPRSGGVRRPGRRPAPAESAEPARTPGGPPCSGSRTSPRRARDACWRRSRATASGSACSLLPCAGTPAGSRSPASRWRPSTRTVSHVIGELLVAGSGAGARRPGWAPTCWPAPLSPRSSGFAARSPSSPSVRTHPGCGCPRTRDEIAALATTMNQLLDPTAEVP